MMKTIAQIPENAKVSINNRKYTLDEYIKIHPEILGYSARKYWLGKYIRENPNVLITAESLN